MRNNVAMSDAVDSLGTIAAAGLIAREIDRAHAGRPAVGHEESEACANCGTERVGPYCHACGQAGHVHRNLGALVHDIAHGVFHFEGKLWHTLPLLAWRPGELTRRYVDGERAKFVSPMALFLFCVFLMFAILPHLAGGHTDLGTKVSVATELSQERTKLATLQAKRVKQTDPEDIADLDKRIAKSRESVDALEGVIKSGVSDIPTAVAAAKRDGGGAINANTGWHWLDTAVNHAAENPQLLLYKLKMNAYKYSWALVPISLPFIWLLFFWRRDVGLYDHAIFAIYSLSFMSLATVILVVLSKIGLPAAIAWLAAMIIPPVHMYRQLKGTYRLRRLGALVRTFFLLWFTLITSSIFFSFLLYLGTE